MQPTETSWKHATDWTCEGCGNVNWEWRKSCNKCGNAAPTAAFGDEEGPYDVMGSKRLEKLKEEDERQQREQQRKASGQVDADLARVQRRRGAVMPLITSSMQMPALYGSIDNPIMPELSVPAPAPVPVPQMESREDKPRPRDEEPRRDAGRRSRSRSRERNRRSRSRSRDRRRSRSRDRRRR